VVANSLDRVLSEDKPRAAGAEHGDSGELAEPGTDDDELADDADSDSDESDSDESDNA